MFDVQAVGAAQFGSTVVEFVAISDKAMAQFASVFGNGCRSFTTSKSESGRAFDGLSSRGLTVEAR